MYETWIHHSWIYDIWIYNIWTPVEYMTIEDTTLEYVYDSWTLRQSNIMIDRHTIVEHMTVEYSNRWTQFAEKFLNMHISNIRCYVVKNYYE